MSRRESLIRGAAALAVAGLFIKVTGLFVRIPLTRLIGAEGIGIYTMAFPVFHALYHLAAGGIPVAVQNMVAESMAKGRQAVAEQIFRIAFRYAVIVGGLASCVLVWGSTLFAGMLGDKRVELALMILAPGILLFAVDNMYRSYMQGRKLMTPSATASIMEQATKVAITVLGAYLLVDHGLAHAAAGAAFGVACGALISVGYSAWIRRRVVADELPSTADGDLESDGTIFRRMWVIAWPVTVASVIMPIFGLLDVGIVQRGFQQAGYTVGQATALYGAYQGIAVQIAWFPFVLTNAFANALVPVLAGAKAADDWDMVRQRVRLGIRAVALICLPVAVGICLLARPLAELFGEPQAAGPLVFLAPVAFLGPLAWLTASQLQALGKTQASMWNFGIAWALKLGADFIVARIPGVDAKGVALVSVGMFLLVACLNARSLEQEIDDALPWGAMLRGPLVASIAMGGALVALILSGILPSVNWGAIGIVGVVAPVLYTGALAATGSLTWAELREIGGPTVAKLERIFHSLWPF